MQKSWHYNYNFTFKIYKFIYKSKSKYKIYKLVVTKYSRLSSGYSNLCLFELRRSLGSAYPIQAKTLGYSNSSYLNRFLFPFGPIIAKSPSVFPIFIIGTSSSENIDFLRLKHFFFKTTGFNTHAFLHSSRSLSNLFNKFNIFSFGPQSLDYFRKVHPLRLS